MKMFFCLFLALIFENSTLSQERQNKPNVLDFSLDYLKKALIANNFLIDWEKAVKNAGINIPFDESGEQGVKATFCIKGDKIRDWWGRNHDVIVIESELSLKIHNIFDKINSDNIPLDTKVNSACSIKNDPKNGGLCKCKITFKAEDFYSMLDTLNTK